jgi:adenine-specific DNA-methyltransferase
MARSNTLFADTTGSTDIGSSFHQRHRATVFRGDCLDLLRQIPDGSVQLVVTSPPYNIGKSYEKRTSLKSYLEQQRRVISECVRVLGPEGNLCWQVGNFVDRGSIVPLDIVLYPVFADLGLQMRNRIVWRFEHGLHCSRRLSGRYETICWYSRSDSYYFDADPIRVPQKYPGKKYFKGPKAGQLSCNPLGKNPGDVWEIPNVKNNHVEKTDHPCQFPVELVERLVLSLSRPGDLVLDPYLGVGSTCIAAIRHGRRGAGAEIDPGYAETATERVGLEARGELRTRPMNRPIYEPPSTPSAAARRSALFE